MGLDPLQQMHRCSGSRAVGRVQDPVVPYCICHRRFDCGEDVMITLYSDHI
ncbi:hypothetical protein A2U01_0009086, partial [Trifolium medium]|nr:hypothetical protein [Trifolium medium]